MQRLMFSAGESSKTFMPIRSSTSQGSRHHMVLGARNGIMHQQPELGYLVDVFAVGF